MAGLNKVMLICRLGRDPEIRYSQNGTAVCNFSGATSEKWKDKNTGEMNKKTEWHRLVAWGKQAEILEKYLSKGSQVYLEGKLQTRNYEKDGVTHYTTEIVVQNFQFLGDRQDNQGGAQSGGYGQAQGQYNQQGQGYQGGAQQQQGNYQQKNGYQNQGQQGYQQQGQGQPIPDDDTIPF